MRKLKLFFTACALFVGTGMTWAQTDVTSTYLTNADFSGTKTSYSQPKSDRHIYQPNGWSIDVTNVSQWNATVVNIDDPQQSGNFTGDYAPTGGKYMVRFRDNQTTEYIDLSQTVTITEAGLYLLSAGIN